jgi:single-strand DNA-binding protein
MPTKLAADRYARISTVPDSSTTRRPRLPAVGRGVSPRAVNGLVGGTRVAAARIAVREESPMFETPFTIVGNIVNDPVHRSVGEHEVVKFRVASNSRRRNPDGEWEPGNSLFVTVNCWGRLVAGVSAALVKGDPVVVVGHVYTSEYDDKEGNRRSSVEVRATSVGPDLTRCTARIDRKQQAEPPAEATVADVEDGEDVDPAEEAGGLPLTA